MAARGRIGVLVVLLALALALALLRRRSDSDRQTSVGQVTRARKTDAGRAQVRRAWRRLGLWEVTGR